MIKIALPFGPDNQRDNYRNALKSVGIVGIEDARKMDGLAGLLLAGGGDVDTTLYGALPAPETEEPDVDRDAIELDLIREALKKDLPIFAICRGLQILNVACGGTLIQHIEGHKSDELEAHTIDIVPDTQLEKILRPGPYAVNTSHHQAIEKIGNGLVVSARSPDGIIEAIEFPGKRFVLGVQWHPERRLPGPDSALFQAFRNSIKPEVQNEA